MYFIKYLGFLGYSHYKYIVHYDRNRKICLEEQLSKDGKDTEHRRPKMQLVLCCSLSASGGRYPTQINGTRRLLRFTITRKISPRVAVTNVALASEPFCC